MGQINGIVHMAMIIVISLAVLIGAGVGIYFWYTASGQEEGE